MLTSLNTAISGMQAFQQDIDVIGNNIANVNTTGFKDVRADFSDSFSQALGFSPNYQLGTGVNPISTTSNFNQGTLNNTNVATDIAISGQGFFVVRNSTDNSQYVTRAGEFHLDANGYLITSGGFRLQGYSDSGLTTIGDLKIDATGAPATAAPGATVQRFSIDQRGNINVVLSDGTTFVRGQVLLQNCNDLSQLVREGNNLYTMPASAGPLTQPGVPNSHGLGSLEAGALEMSNVDLTGEMANLITAQRAFQANARMITTSDEILQEVVALKR